jgi:hypothetical protein
VQVGEDDIDTARLFDQIVVDKVLLADGIRRALRGQAQVSLRELVECTPLVHGLAELVAYLQLAHDEGNAAEGFRAVVDEAVQEPVCWQACDSRDRTITREARLPRVIFVR